MNQQAYALGAARSCIRELYEYGRQRAKIVGEENVYDFSLGNPSIPSPAGVTEALRELIDREDSLSLHSYTTSVGDYSAREAIARDLNQRFGCDIQPQELFIGCGAAPELCAVFKALSFPGGEFLSVSPYFPEHRPFAEMAGGIFRPLAPNFPDFSLPLEAISQAVTEKTAALIINSPNNPTGKIYSREELEALAQILTKKSKELGRPIYIVSDEPYRELCYDGAEVPFLPGIYPNTVVCYSYSKSLSLPGERIGYVYVPRQAQDGETLYLAVAGAARGLGHVCAPSLWQKVIARCAHLRPNLEAYNKNRLSLYGGLTACGYEAVKPQGAFYLFVKAPYRDFLEKAKEKDVLLVPGEGFGCPGWFRMSYCVSYETIQKALPIMAQLIENPEKT